MRAQSKEFEQQVSEATAEHAKIRREAHDGIRSLFEACYGLFLSSQAEAPGTADERARELWEQAAEHMVKAARSAQGQEARFRTWVLLNCGYVLKRHGKVAEALVCATEACSISPDDADAPYNAACYAALLGRIEEGLRYMRSALENAARQNTASAYVSEADGDGDLANLKSTQAYLELLAKFR